MYGWEALLPSSGTPSEYFALAVLILWASAAQSPLEAPAEATFLGDLMWPGYPPQILDPEKNIYSISNHLPDLLRESRSFDS